MARPAVRETEHHEFAGEPRLPDIPLELSDDARVPISLIDSSPRNPRKRLADVEALADNIKIFGLLQPVMLRRVSGRYQVLAGHRRLAAFRLLRERHPWDGRWCSIPAVVRSTDDTTAGLMLISGQVHISNWTVQEEAAALAQLLSRGRTFSEVATLLNKTPSWASKRCRVHVDPVLAGFVQSGKLAATVAEELLPVCDTARRQDLAERAAAESWSQSEARRAVRGANELALQVRQLMHVLARLEPVDVTEAVWRDLVVLQTRIGELCGGSRSAAA